MKLSRLLSRVLLAAVCGGAHAAADPAAVRAQFAFALDAAVNRQPLPEITPELRAYPLFAYLTAEQLRQSMDDPLLDSDTNISAFLKLVGDQPVARTLRPL